VTGIVLVTGTASETASEIATGTEKVAETETVTATTTESVATAALFDPAPPARLPRRILPLEVKQEASEVGAEAGVVTIADRHGAAEATATEREITTGVVAVADPALALPAAIGAGMIVATRTTTTTVKTAIVDVMMTVARRSPLPS